MRIQLAHRMLMTAFAAIGVVVFAACGATTLQTSDFDSPDSFLISNEAGIPSNAENKAVLDTINSYRIAMSDRDVNALRSLVASNYYENASTTDNTEDDYGNEKLEELFADYLGDAVKEVRYDMEIQRLTRDNEHVLVDYSYAWNFRYTSEGREHWKSERDVNRLTLVQEGNVWKIASGL